MRGRVVVTDGAGGGSWRQEVAFLKSIELVLTSARTGQARRVPRGKLVKCVLSGHA